MNDEEKEKRVLSALAVSRPERFWAVQKAAIEAAVRPPANRGAWLLLPAAGLAALLVAVMVEKAHRQAAPEPQAVSLAFIEHMDMLADMDVLEAVPEGKL